MDKTYEPIGNKPGEKIKVDSIDTIVTTHGDKPHCYVDRQWSSSTGEPE